MRRLASAVIDHAKSVAARPAEDPKDAWLLIDGVGPALARAIVELWPSELPPIFVAAPPDDDFGDVDLRTSSATRQRNKGGLCLVVCEGQQVPDGQSIVGFQRCGPEQLLDEPGVRRLALADPSVAAHEGVDSLYEALIDPRLESPPAARAVAELFDEMATGAPLGEALPKIGGFRDDAQPGSLKPDRIRANLNLAAERSSADRLSPSSLSEIRKRANRHFKSLENGELAGDEIVNMLLARDSSILRELTFDDAVAVLEQPQGAELPAAIRSDLERYAAEAPDAAQPIKDALPLVDQLDDPLARKEASRELLELDVTYQSEIFNDATRRRLRAQGRDRSVSEPALEAGLIRAIDNLTSPLRKIELRQPQPNSGGSSEAALKAIVSVAAAHVRISPLLRHLEQRHGVSVDALLVAAPGAELHGALNQLQGRGAAAGRQIKVGVKGQAAGDSVEVVWTPTEEDFAVMVALSSFSTAAGHSLWLEAQPVDGAITTAGVRPTTPPPSLGPLAREVARVADQILRAGYEPDALREWTASWSDAVEAFAFEGRSGSDLDAIALAGCIRDVAEVATTPLSPLKSEWLAGRTDAWIELLDLAAEGAAGRAARSPGDTSPAPIVTTARALGATTSARYPGYFALSGRETPLLPATDGSLVSTFGRGELGENMATPPTEPIQASIRKLIDLHPEAARHLRCAAWGNHAADLLAGALIRDMSRSPLIGSAELSCVAGEPSDETLNALDEFVRGQDSRRIQLRYVQSLDAWPQVGDEPQVHLALIEGITHGESRVNPNIESVPHPPSDEDVLFMPRTWVRPNRSRVLLMPPRLSSAGLSWYRLMSAIVEDEWPGDEGQSLRVPELRTDAAPAAETLAALHERALWVATLDRYATRDTIQQAAGSNIAIIHQERRVAGDAVYGLVISQRSGGSADRAIARSLKSSDLLDETAAPEIAKGLRAAAAKGYGILALRAATTGSGINELIGHVAAFHRLTSDATPWPLPPGCRVVLVSLDEYSQWFGGGRRADLLALALSPEEGGVHAANIEVKAVKDAGPGAQAATLEAREQLRKTLIDSRFAAYPNGSVFSRLWLNRIAEAAIGVCRENDHRLSQQDLHALDNFRSGGGVLEWAGLAMIFAPAAIEPPQHSHMVLMGDRVPIVQSVIGITADLLADAAMSDGTRLRTVETGRTPLPASTKRRSFSRPTGAAEKVEGDHTPDAVAEPDSISVQAEPVPETPATRREETAESKPDGHPAAEPSFDPILGIDAVTAEEVPWKVAGPGALSNGHVEIYGTSGAGKTQFVMSLLAQLKAMGSHFGVCDFKNDYGADFPGKTGAQFYDLWAESLPFNPLAIDDPSRRNLQALTIELRDSVDIAARAYTRLGHRQLTKLQQAFEEAYEQARLSGVAAPTMRDIHELLDEDLLGVIGDLTGTELFGSGPPLGEVIDHDVVFGLNRIPGTGMTTTLAAGFILAALYLKLLELPQVANQVRYTLVIDEAHRVGHFHSVGSMVRELRSKGLAVVLATQRPGDLPDVASTNAQTKIYMRLPDAHSARDAAKALDPSDRDLPEMIRTLADGEAFISFAGSAPRLVRLRQFWRDHAG